MSRSMAFLSAVVLVLGINGTVSLAATINNAGFESGPFPPYPGYSSSIPGWTGAAGVNPPSSGSAPFLNGLAPPEGTHAGFQQSSGTLSQTATGFVPGNQYVLQYFENERGSGAAIAKLQIKLGGQTIVPTHNVTRTSQWVTVVGDTFTAASGSALLEVIHPGGGTGDNTALFDDFIISEAGVPFVKNASFEEGPVNAWPGYGAINRWTRVAGSSGTNDSAGPFVNGLPIPEGASVGFIQGSGTVSQTVVGLIPGRQYVLEYYQDERGSSVNPVAGPSASVDGIPVVSQVELIRTPQFRRVVSRPFTATATSAVLELRNTGIQSDNTLLLDAVSVRPIGVLLLQDNFDLPNNPATPHVPAGNYDVNAGLGGRQAGLFAGTRYVETAHSASGVGDLASQIDFADIPSAAPDALFLGADASPGASYTAVSPDRNFAFGSIHIGRMTFEFDVDPYLPGSTSGDNWASFRFGDDTPVQYVGAAGNGFGILFREGGAFEAFDGNTYLGSGTAFTGSGFHAIRIDVETYAFDGSPATILAYADGSATPFLTYAKPGGFTDNFITLGGYSGAGQMLHGFDNLMVYAAAVPEPSTSLLLALGGLALGLVNRRRRR